ncbi:unnamed protein product [Rhizoctonia solani]|uniref:Uncharacterized protein n=1 Tax=Rhizoctonia solani TaxID=456999 RepID=A0A8H3GTR2_9AGAM|nr:unnamed protein product [Rhizoctonia solani]
MDRPAKDPEWGPGIREYPRTFRSRLQSAFERYIDQEEVMINASRDILPLSLLETTLAVGENMHVVGFQTGDQIFPALMDTIRKYTAICNGRIFDHYYGFLCIRHLVRMVCIGTLTQCGMFDRVLDELDHHMPWTSLLGVLSDATLMYMQAILLKHDHENCGPAFTEGPLFLEATALDADDAKFLLGLLWKDRAPIILLRTQDALPGLPALILVLSQMIARTPSHRKINPAWLCIQDISLRCYLGCLKDTEQTDEERYVLHRINQFIVNLFDNQNVSIMDTYEAWLAVDDRDARLVVNTYTNLTKPGYPKTPLRLDFIMLRWVFGLLRNPQTRRPALDELAPIVFKTALALLHGRIDGEAEELMDRQTRSLIRVFLHDILDQISAFDSSKPRREVRDIFWITLIDSDIFGAMGRILVMITRELDKPRGWGPFLDGIIAFGKLVNRRRLPAKYTESMQYEWSKLMIYMNHLGSGVIVPSEIPRYLFENARNTWFLLAEYPPRDDTFKRLTCAYPRCADPDIITHTPRCQHMHWKLNTWESHSPDCWLN